MDLGTTSAFERTCQANGLKFSKPIVPAIAEPTMSEEANAFQRACQENGIRVSKSLAAKIEGEITKVNVYENTGEVKLPKSPPRVINEESMFEKACGSKGIRISKLNPKGGDLGKMAGEGEVEEKKTVVTGDQALAKPAFRAVWKNKGIKFSISGAEMHDVAKDKGMSDIGDKHDAFLDGALSVISGDGKAKDTPKDVGFGYDFWVTNLAGEENESVTTELPNKSPSGPLTSFTVFPALPFELKAKIWKLSIVPRIIICDNNENPIMECSAAKPPAILHVCQQSREQGLKVYTKIVVNGFLKRTRRSVCVDSENDIFYVNKEQYPLGTAASASTRLWTSLILAPSWFQMVQRLSLEPVDADKAIRIRQMPPLAMRLFRIYFPSLREVVTNTNTRAA